MASLHVRSAPRGKAEHSLSEPEPHPRASPTGSQLVSRATNQTPAGGGGARRVVGDPAEWAPLAEDICRPLRAPGPGCVLSVPPSTHTCSGTPPVPPPFLSGPPCSLPWVTWCGPLGDRAEPRPEELTQTHGRLRAAATRAGRTAWGARRASARGLCSLAAGDVPSGRPRLLRHIPVRPQPCPSDPSGHRGFLLCASDSVSSHGTQTCAPSQAEQLGNQAVEQVNRAHGRPARPLPWPSAWSAPRGWGRGGEKASRWLRL